MRAVILIAAGAVVLAVQVCYADTIRVPEDQPTIQMGIDAATPGDTVLVSPGTYTEWNIELRSGVSLVGSENPPGVTLAPGSNAPVVTCAFVETLAVISSITIEGATGSTSPLGCAGSELRVENVEFVSNYPQFEGGAVYIYDSDVEFVDCAFSDNHTDYPGGGAVYADLSSVDFLRCDFEGNSAPAGEGGALWAGQGTFTLDSCTLRGNSSVMGGACCFESGGSADLQTCLFEENLATYGGGAAASDNAAVAVTSCTFLSNSTDSHGGALMILHQTCYIDGSLFDGNTSDNVGGAVMVAGEGLVVQHSVFIDNSASGYGGAIHVIDRESDLDVNCCTLVRNSAPGGGGIAFGAILGNFGNDLTLSNTIIAYGSSGEAVWNEASTIGALSVTCCDVFGNAGGDYVSTLNGLEGSQGNFSLAPLFCDLPADDVYLQHLSPCLPGNHPQGQSCGLIGALGEGCATPVQATTWGGIKAMFR